MTDTPPTRAATLRLERMAMSALAPHEKNPRRHPEPGTPAWAVLKASLEHDYFDPIVFNIRNGKLVSGHLRTKVLTASGYTEADVVIVDYDEPTHLARMIAANKGAGEDDMGALKDLLLELDTGALDMALTGFETRELEEMMTALPPENIKDAEPQFDRAEELLEKWKVKRGDVWRIGNHRLMCGDSTSAEDVEMLMGGVSPSIMVTDPPYGIEYDPSWRADAGVNKNTGKMGKVTNDDNADWTSAWKNFTGSIAYIYHAGIMSSTVQKSIESCGFKIRAQIIWAKDRMALSRGDYHWQHEPCWYAVKEHQKGNRNEDRTQTTLWEINSRDDGGHGHGTQKPVECMARPIRNHLCEFVYDPFNGSGTTLVACEQLNRKGLAMEIEPKYISITLERLKGIGLTPELLA